MLARRIEPRYTPVRLGLTTYFVVVPAALLAVAHGFAFLTYRYPGENWAHVISNVVLLGLLGALYLAWALALSRDRVPETAGAGFGLMGFALAGRVYCEFIVLLPGGVDLLQTSPTLVWVRAFRAATLFGYAFGLATVLASVWAARRLP